LGCRDFQPAAAAAAYFGFGELEEALIHGGGGAGNAHGVDPGVIIKNDVAQAKCKFFFFISISVLSLESGPGLYLLAKKARSFHARLRTGTAPHRARHASPFVFLPVSIPMQTVCICSCGTCILQ
jgi:hypothetical protein